MHHDALKGTDNLYNSVGGDRHFTVKTQHISSVTHPLLSEFVPMNAACDLVWLVWFGTFGLLTFAANLRRVRSCER